MSRYKLSLPAAIFININIMIGAGIFINTTLLAQLTGILGGLCYVIIGLLSLPLILSIAHLIKLYPAGGFYTFAHHELGISFGFISAWSYFIGKLASCSLIIHTCVLLLQQLIPSLQTVMPLALDVIIIGLFILLNQYNIKTGSKIQYVFIVFKLIPILSIIALSLWMYNGQYLNPDFAFWSGIPLILPFVLYATMGFEATCSLSNNIENARVNGPRAIFISYAIVILLAFLYQTSIYLCIADHLTHTNSYLTVFPTLMHRLFHPRIATAFYTFLHLFIASSALGGAYGILYSNSWNLHTLAQNNHLFFSPYLQSLNRYSIPFACVIIEGLFCLVYLITTHGNQIILQQLGSLGSIVAYTLSVISLLVHMKNRAVSISLWIPLCGILNCIILAGACIRGLLLAGPKALGLFIIIVILGFMMFLKKGVR